MKKNAKKTLSALFIMTALITFSCENMLQPPTIDPPNGFYIIDDQPASSPDGRTIAYVGSFDGGNKYLSIGLFLIDTNGTNKRLIHDGIVSSPSWSPDGEWLTFSEIRQIYKIKANGDSLTQLTFEGRNFDPDWSTDGNLIVYSRDYSYPESIKVKGIWRVNPINNYFEQLYSGFVGYPIWDINSNNIYFFRGAVLNNGNVIGDTLWRYEISNNIIHFVLFLSEPHNWDNRYPKISSNNYSITFTSQPNNGSSPQIWIINVDGSGLKRLTADGGYTSDWSPDGEKIIYCNTSEGNGRLWIMNKDGSGKKQLTFPN